jgi:hypothetical protein
MAEPSHLAGTLFLTLACAAPVVLFLQLFTVLGSGIATFRWAAREEKLAYPLLAVVVALPSLVFVFDG